ncbi:hypothetical protein ACO2I3_12345 [Leptospira interrogans]
MRIKMKAEHRHKLNSVSTKTYPKDWQGTIADDLALEWIEKGLAEPVIDEASVLANITKAVQAEAERIEAVANAPATDGIGQPGSGVDGGGDPSTDTAGSSQSSATSADDGDGGSGGATSGPSADATGSPQIDGQSVASGGPNAGVTPTEPQHSSQEENHWRPGIRRPDSLALRPSRKPIARRRHRDRHGLGPAGTKSHAIPVCSGARRHGGRARR